MDRYEYLTNETLDENGEENLHEKMSCGVVQEGRHTFHQTFNVRKDAERARVHVTFLN